MSVARRCARNGAAAEDPEQTNGPAIAPLRRSVGQDRAGRGGTGLGPEVPDFVARFRAMRDPKKPVLLRTSIGDFWLSHRAKRGDKDPATAPSSRHLGSESCGSLSGPDSGVRRRRRGGDLGDVDHQVGRNQEAACPLPRLGRGDPPGPRLRGSRGLLCLKGLWRLQVVSRCGRVAGTSPLASLETARAQLIARCMLALSRPGAESASTICAVRLVLSLNVSKRIPSPSYPIACHHGTIGHELFRDF